MKKKFDSEKLLILADFLEKNAKNQKGIKFDMNSWGDFEGNKPEISCNSTGCALGSAAIAKLFPGLSYKIIEEGEGRGIIPKYKGKSDIEAAVKLFNISLDEAQLLFWPSYYEETDEQTKGAAGEKFVAKRIRDFVTYKVYYEEYIERVEELKKEFERTKRRDFKKIEDIVIEIVEYRGGY